MLIQFISWAFTAYETLILIWAIMSWFPDARYSDLGRWVGRLVEPYVELFDRFIPPIGSVSLSAFAALAVLHLVRNFLLRLLIGV